MQLIIQTDGVVRCLYDEALELTTLGGLNIRRASQVEPTVDGRWTADLAPVGGPALGLYENRSEALAAESSWLHANQLPTPLAVAGSCSQSAASTSDASSSN